MTHGGDVKRLPNDRWLEKQTDKNVHKLPVVRIVWLDSANTHGWRRPDDLKGTGLTEAQSVGFLYRNNEKEIQVVQSVDDSHNVGERLAIPRQCVTSVKRLQ